jgi:phosphoribosylamine--glycine ligase
MADDEECAVPHAQHALARALLCGRDDREVVVAPGNPGMEGPRLDRRPIDPTSGPAVVALARELGADLVVIGPEAPLVAGVADALAEAGIPVFGPSKAAARLEGSKAFLKELAVSQGIPTAKHVTVRTIEEAERVIAAWGAPIVVKADGLCAGKGVVVASTVDEAREAARAMLVDRVFGAAGEVVVIEACLAGKEASVHAVTDGERFVVLPAARDHKRVFDGDRGPNTGGMGVVAPAPGVDAALLERVGQTIIEPTLAGMRALGTPFRGVLFAGLMVSPEGEPMLLEHNVRFGDPECEALMALAQGDVGEWLASAAAGSLDPSRVRFTAGEHAVVVVLAAEGYPSAPRAGDAIARIDEAEGDARVVVHHAGTKRDGDRLVTSGGRVLAVTATGPSLDEARAHAYRAADVIDFAGKHFRRDIGLG